MMDGRDDPRGNFTYFSNEYAQALQAYATIEQQASTLIALGSSDELLTFINQFVEMADRTRSLAIEKNEPNFAEWFAELIEKAEAIRGAIVER